MKESEIKRAIEKINWNVSGVKCIINDDPQFGEITVENLTRDCKLLEESKCLVEALCDYMIDDGSVDVSEELEAVYVEADRTLRGEYGQMPENTLTDETQPLYDRIMECLSAITFVINDYWEWKERRGAQGGEASSPLRPDEINEDKIKSLFLPYQHNRAESFIKTLKTEMTEQFYTPGFKNYKKKSLAKIMAKVYELAEHTYKSTRAQILTTAAQNSFDYFQREVFASLGETSPSYRIDIIKGKS